MDGQFTNIQQTMALLCILLLFFTGVKHYAKRTLIPAEGWVLIAGLIYGLAYKHISLSWMPDISMLPPEVILTLFLPLLIFASGQRVKTSILRSEGLAIGFYAVAGVIASAFIIGLPTAVFLDIKPVHGLLMGAAMGATDPSAVGTIFHRFQMPERLKLLVEGESLFNDGVTVVLFSVAMGLAIGNTIFEPFHTALHFIWALIGAIPLGMLLGWASARLIKHWHEHHIFFTSSMSLILAYGGFLLSETLLHVSGVITVLIAAIAFVKNLEAQPQPTGDPTKYRIMEIFWDYISQTLSLFMFFLLGVATGRHDFVVTAATMIVAIGALILSRILIVYGSALILRLLRVRLPLSWQHVLTLGGLRGGVSAALIMLIPADYPYQQIFLCLAFAMIGFTLVLQPVLMQIYLQWTRIPEKEK